jgi:accessory gene regulator protein AgrB
MKLTRREKHVLIAALIIAIIFVIVRPSYETVQEWEGFLWFIVLAPLGFYIATDQERKKAGS